MKVVSWNILHGGGKRVNDIVDSIAFENADIVCLQEFRHGSTKRPLVDGLNQLGFTSQYAPEPPSHRKNTVALFSRFPFVDNQSRVLFADDDTARCLSVTVKKDHAETINVIGVSLPHKKAQLPVFDQLLALPSSYRAESSLMVGDFNCGIPFEDSQTRTFYATHRFQSLLQQGWIDSWRTRNPKTKEFSWFSTQKGNGFRYDHALSSPAMNQQIKSVSYNHAVREQRISDHSMLIVES